MEIKGTKIDLACGDNKREGYIGIDKVKTDSTDYVWDLAIYPWPIESESVEEINCSHYLEHIPHRNTKKELEMVLAESSSFEEFKQKMQEKEDEPDGFVKFINEIYRILKPEGKVHIVSPYYTSMRAFGDPTHERYISDSSFWYLDKKWMTDNNLSHYGLNCDFKVKVSYYISNEMTLKSEDVRREAFKNDWNAIDDILVELIKR